MFIEDRFFDQEFVQEMSNEDFRMLFYLIHFSSKKTGIVELNMRMVNFSANTGKTYSVDDVLKRFGNMLCLIPGKRTTAIFPAYIFCNWMKRGVPENVNTHPLYKSILSELSSFGLTLEDVMAMRNKLKRKGDEGGKELDAGLGNMDSHHPVLPDTGGISTACDRVDSCAILHRAVEGGLEEGTRGENGTEGDEKEKSDEVIDHESLFSEFWEAYPSECPRKVDKKKCRDKFTRILKKSKDPRKTFDSIMDGLSVWKSCDTWTSDGGRYIRSPLVWLNGMCWNDNPTKGVAIRNGNDVRRASNANANFLSEETEGLF